MGLVPSTHMVAHKPSVIPVPEDPVPSPGTLRHQACMGNTDIDANKAFIYIK